MKFFENIKDRIASMEEKTKKGWRLCFALCAAVFTLFTLVSIVSYFFTWKADQSLLGAVPADASVVSNSASSLGFKWGHFLVTSSFGVASLAIVAILTALTVKLFRKDLRINSRKWILSGLTGTMILSLVAAFIGPFAGLDYAFGAGLGGRFGSVLVSTSVGLVGFIMTGIIIVALGVLWGYLSSHAFELVLSENPEKPSTDVPGDDPVAPSNIEPVQPLVVEPVPAVVRPQRTRLTRAEKKEEVLTDEDEPSDSEEEEASLEVERDDTLDERVRKELPRINNRDELPQYNFPTLDLLNDYTEGRHEVSQEELQRNNIKIRRTLESYKIQVSDVKAIVGPTVTLYKVYPAEGVKISSIKNLQDDIAMKLSAKGVRVVTLQDSVGIEVANDTASIVPLKALLNNESFRESKAELPVAIGYTITKKVQVFDLADAPHLLIAGATKQGKSVGLNVIVTSLLYAKHPSELKFVFIDPKMVEFSSYARLLNHYLAVLPTAASEQDEMDNAIVKNAKTAAAVLQSLCVEMDTRYELLSKAMVNNIKLYNEQYKSRHLLPTEGHHFLPYIVVVVDEYADLTMSVGAGPESKALARSITTSIIRLAQKGRAAGLHVILATQRPTVDVVTGLIKTNFPMRIAFRVTSRVDSQTILDQNGADKLIGRGDMLLYTGIETERVQCAFIGNDEIIKITSFIGDQKGYKKSYNTPFYLPEPAPQEGDGGGELVDMKALDDRFEEAARMVVQNQRGSTSDLQRRLGMGYARAGKVMDQLEAAGIVGPQVGAKPREVLVKDFRELDEILSHFI